MRRQPRPLEGARVSSRLVLGVFCVVVVLNTLAAYTIFGIPFPWIGRLLAAVIATGLVLQEGRIRAFSGWKLLLAFMVWAALITIFHAGDYRREMPPLSTTSYGVFILLRFLTIFSFAGMCYVAYWLCLDGRSRDVVRFVVGLGAVVAVVAIYMYFAQLWGWPEPPRNRIGTGGQASGGTVFSYAFHRAVGPLREPSDFARWLLLPLFASFLDGRTLLDIRKLLIGSAFLLTGSLSGIAAAAIGVVLASLLSRPLSPQRWLDYLRLAVFGVILLGCFDALVETYTGDTVTLPHVLLERTRPILEEGLEASNRGYIYQYVQDYPPDLFGVGIGNANIEFSLELGSPLPASYICLYISTLYGTGLFGLALLSAFLLTPLALSIRKLAGSGDAGGNARWLLTAYLAHLVVFGFAAEELSLRFGVGFALLTYELTDGQRVPGQTPATGAG